MFAASRSAAPAPFTAGRHYTVKEVNDFSVPSRDVTNLFLRCIGWWDSRRHL
jgi:hypothetical protein